MNSGRKYLSFCEVVHMCTWVQPERVGASWKGCYGSVAVVHSGACYPRNMANGTACTNALGAGATRACGSRCSAILPMSLTWRTCWSTAPLSGPTHVRRGLQKKRPGNPHKTWAPPGAAHDTKTRQGRRLGHTPAREPDTRA